MPRKPRRNRTGKFIINGNFVGVVVPIDLANMFNDLKIVIAAATTSINIVTDTITNHRSKSRSPNLLKTDKFSLNIHFDASFFLVVVLFQYWRVRYKFFLHFCTHAFRVYSYMRCCCSRLLPFIDSHPYNMQYAYETVEKCTFIGTS